MSRVKGQHHVWKFHLEAWHSPTQLYFRRSGKVLPSKASQVAKQHLFYAPNRMHDIDIQQLRRLMIDHTSGSLRKLQETTLSFFTEPFAARDRGERLGASPEAIARLDLAIEQMIEQYHSSIETDSVKYLTSLRQSDLSFLREDTWIEFTYFIAQQYTRTRRMRDMARNSVEHPVLRDQLGRIWPALSQLMANILGQAIYTRRSISRYVILMNDSSIGFISGDQPIINLASSPSGGATELELYYPISPKIALLISPFREKHPEALELISATQAHDYNQKIKDQSYEELYGSDRCYLEGI